MPSVLSGDECDAFGELGRQGAVGGAEYRIGQPLPHHGPVQGGVLGPDAARDERPADPRRRPGTAALAAGAPGARPGTAAGRPALAVPGPPLGHRAQRPGRTPLKLSAGGWPRTTRPASRQLAGQRTAKRLVRTPTWPGPAGRRSAPARSPPACRCPSAADLCRVNGTSGPGRRSTTRMDRPRRASSQPRVSPVGPAPTISTSRSASLGPELLVSSRRGMTGSSKRS